MTNFYFEGRKAASRKAKFGRSKEKRSDCRLLVLALCINTDGFIRYSAILEAGTADPKSLPAMVDIERVARAQGKYPSISQYYDIEYIRSETNPDNMERVEWTIRDLSALESGHGVYFLRTNIRTFEK